MFKTQEEQTMGFFDFFKGADINAGVAEYQGLSRAMLIDVREADEFGGGHIPGARNIPLSRLNKVTSAIQDKDMPLYVYCLSGGRSASAAAALKRMGYTEVHNIGGINSYRGALER